MIKLEYGNGNNRKLISECTSINNAFSKMDEYLEDINFESPYYRVILPREDDKKKEMWVDFGSYINFFYINGFSDDDYELWRKENEE